MAYIRGLNPGDLYSVLMSGVIHTGAYIWWLISRDLISGGIYPGA